jgi:hypothetical protein
MDSLQPDMLIITAILQLNRNQLTANSTTSPIQEILKLASFTRSLGRNHGPVLFGDYEVTTSTSSRIGPLRFVSEWVWLCCCPDNTVP